jgi:hypothetical protein
MSELAKWFLAFAALSLVGVSLLLNALIIG